MIHDQILLVLCGHHHGRSFRIDENRHGNPVHQILADYQVRGQVAVQAGRKRWIGTGDGWLRLMTFDFATSPATITVRTYSSHYGQYSPDMDRYADWYRATD